MTNTLTKISPERAKSLIEQGAVLVDVRESEERAREHLPAARHLPLSKLNQTELSVEAGQPILFHCRSGARTSANAAQLSAKLGEGCEAYIVEGGLDALKRVGVPIVVDRSQPMELSRQVQIGAGSFGLLGTLLGLLVSPWFFAVPLFVGAGLIFAGVTGFCGLARVLMLAPWNRAAKAA
jgi:rhodanese-related sulfurtransferase